MYIWQAASEGTAPAQLELTLLKHPILPSTVEEESPPRPSQSAPVSTFVAISSSAGVWKDSAMESCIGQPTRLARPASAPNIGCHGMRGQCSW